ncbi:hypothetical protein G7Z17_g1671 [Cylindrodendrum hubeiense]|uniref:High affinity methionine permease n=1 Tax=Cylindrodendrum hubeiense TaxID=595255 RepID=A0A9P5HEF5_9HYPO|nr:hypothetical protein G7Z17_g1671 [Cylindrodendrum hubeiense]
MASWRKPFSSRAAAVTIAEIDPGEYSDGSLKYVGERGGNDAPLTYQEASGAPVENDSPLGYSVGPVTIVLLNVTYMIGTGIYSTPSAILSGTGSVGLSLIYWTLGYLLCLASGAVYLEFTAYFPSRSGSEVVFLEQAFPRPTWFFPTTFAVQNVILSFGSSNAVGLVFNTKYAYWFSNAVGVVKVLTILFVVFTGFAVLGGHTSVEDPKANFRNAFEGASSATGYGLTNALYRIIFSYGGYNGAFNLVNEVKNPVRTLKIHATSALTIVYVLYMFANVAWLSAVTKDELQNSGLTVASLFFTRVFGNTTAVRGINFLIALSAFGNIMAVLIAASRMIRECGRQGVLPWTNFWVSTKPFGTPLGPYFIQWFLTALMILALPTGDAFNFVSDLSVLPSAVFNFAMAIGLYVVRWRRKRANLPETSFKASHIVIIFNILVQLFLIVMPWYPPAGGMYAGDVSFWYATYVVTGIGILLACGLYYWTWVYLLPRWRGYRLRQEVLSLDDGVQTHQISRVPVEQLDEWDANHDATGRLRETGITTTQFQEKGDPSEEISGSEKAV